MVYWYLLREFTEGGIGMFEISMLLRRGIGGKGKMRSLEVNVRGWGEWNGWRILGGHVGRGNVEMRDWGRVVGVV